MQEQLISFETAKLAKEKGFNQLFVYFYNKESEKSSNYELNDVNPPQYQNTDNISFGAVTQSLLQKWLRDIHNIHIYINVDFFTNEISYIWEIFYFNKNYKSVLKNSDYVKYRTYEDALEQCLKESLKLIK